MIGDVDLHDDRSHPFRHVDDDGGGDSDSFDSCDSSGCDDFDGSDLNGVT